MGKGSKAVVCGAMQPNKLPALLLDWLKANPDDYLEFEDVMRRWDVPYGTADMAIRALRARGLIQVARVIRLEARQD